MYIIGRSSEIMISCITISGKATPETRAKTDQTRRRLTRPGETRPDETRPDEFIGSTFENHIYTMLLLH